VLNNFTDSEKEKVILIMHTEQTRIKTEIMVNIVVKRHTESEQKPTNNAEASLVVPSTRIYDDG